MRRLAFVLIALLPGLTASATWGITYDESLAAGTKTCAVVSASGLSIYLDESAEFGRRQQAMVVNLRPRTRAYLAWGEARADTGPAGEDGVGAFSPAETRVIVPLLAISPPAYDWTDADDGHRWRGDALPVERFGEHYGECLDKLGWGAADDYRLSAAAPEPESPSPNGDDG